MGYSSPIYAGQMDLLSIVSAAMPSTQSNYHESKTSVLYTVSRHNRKIQSLVEIPIVGYGLAWVHNPVLSVEPTGKLTTIWAQLKR